MYSILIYLLSNNYKKQTYCIIQGNGMDDKTVLKLKKYFYEVKVYKFGQEKKIKLIRFILYWFDFFKYFLYIKNIKKLVKIIYGNDNLSLYILLKNMKINLLEDGMLNYTPQNWKRKTYLILKGLNKNYKPYGRENNVEKIYLTGLAPIPEEIAHKVEIINLKKLWDNKTSDEQNEILDIFSFDLNIKEKIKGRDIILFTQSLSEDNIITENEKIEIYLKIIKKYPKDKLIIKTHPREKTNYKNIFKEYLVLDNPFPFEILNLLDIKFNKAITLFSTAALGLGENVKVDFYGTEVHTKILERFGSCDNIMKRNCFLEEE